LAILVVGENDLGTINPELSAQWHHAKNGSLSPQDVTAGSGKKVWWKCVLSHEWEASVTSRSNGSGCPYCSGLVPIVGYTDLATTNSELVVQWHPTNNGALTPQNVKAGSTKKVWWKCALSHEWEASVSSRSNGSGCPYCSGLFPIVGVNDLATVDPELAAQWHPTKNGALTPQDVKTGSKKKVWWICSLLHEWAAEIYERARGYGCAICSGHRILVGFNDFATVNPELAAQWHPTKNETLTAQEVTYSSGRKVWWKCLLSHEWEATVNNRASGRDCPNCSGRVPIIGLNDLATVNPALTAQWHPTKNGTLTAKDVTASSNMKVWWICPLSHEWDAPVAKRSIGYGCAICAGKRVLIGFNDLATVNPELAAQWHPTKNGALTPEAVTAGSNKKVSWICPLLHEWDAVINDMSKAYSCPSCYIKTIGVTEQSFREAFEKLSKFDFKSYRIDLVRSSRKSDRAQIDMLNDDLKLAIEYDGEWTHGANGPEGKTLERKFADDKETTQALVDSGYKVIRIREHAREGMLPFVPLDPEYESNVFQVTYKSFGKDKHDINALAKEIITTKVDWFKLDAARC
jgi:hypothetical protein